MKVLIADDDMVSPLYLQDALQDWGFDVVTAMDGTTACRLLQQADAPAIAILDWIMPGMDGIDVCRTLRGMSLDQYTYLIMLTSNGTAESMVAARNAGADDFINKPFDAAQLEARITAARHNAGLETRLRRKTG
jgi:DNA-binding response OmpR family regulator